MHNRWRSREDRRHGTLVPSRHARILKRLPPEREPDTHSCQRIRGNLPLKTRRGFGDAGRQKSRSVTILFNPISFRRRQNSYKSSAAARLYSFLVSGDSEPGLTVSSVSTKTLHCQSSTLAIRSYPTEAMVDAAGHVGFMTGAIPTVPAIVPMPPICR